jgi:predicted nucleic acid-binding protein
MLPEGRPVFLDTSYLCALLSVRDQWHEIAVRWQQLIVQQDRPVVTSEFVLLEVADALSAVGFRKRAVQVIESLLTNALCEVVPASSGLFREGLDLYQGREDKDWGLTDCTSFAVMRDQNLIEALTTDDHFRQSGFRALLLEQI